MDNQVVSDSAARVELRSWHSYLGCDEAEHRVNEPRFVPEISMPMLCAIAGKDITPQEDGRTSFLRGRTCAILPSNG
jgi:hypothetical protein